jgi:threonine/homoserine/homoserine lactone efflux protein
MDIHLAAILQVAQTVIPVAGGVLIAWMAFRWNSKKEHQQWIRDQKKVEWKELLVKVSAIEEIIPGITSGLPNY